MVAEAVAKAAEVVTVITMNNADRSFPVARARMAGMGLDLRIKLLTINNVYNIHTAGSEFILQLPRRTAGGWLILIQPLFSTAKEKRASECRPGAPASSSSSLLDLRPPRARSRNSCRDPAHGMEQLEPFRRAH